MAKAAFVRARTDDQIEIRREEILAAAADLIMEQGFDSVSLNGIARRAGIAKSNLYRYFDSKEEILFQVMLADYEDWFDDLKMRWRLVAKLANDAVIARHIADSLVDRERLCQFISIKASVVEKNLSEESMARFSDIIMPKANDLATLLTVCLPHLTFEQAGQFLKAVHALIAGLWPMSRQTVQGNHPESPDWQTDFTRDLEQTAFYLLAGMRAV